MVRLPAGAFRMGTPGRPGQEPAHGVALRAFAIGRHEVTQGQWKALMGGNPSRAAACGDDCPVERVSWHDARKFVRRLSEKTGRAYRLPSEAEWEYACRAGMDDDWCGGNEFSRVAWGGDARGGPRPVGGKQANAWGLHDMSGNVWEWTQDCAHPNYHGAPGDGSAWETGGDCASRILRGGSWLSGPQYGRIGIRFGFSADYRSGDFGFRVAATIEDAPDE
ncbi:MAG: formylglycine-generating enzyme family protein [Rhodocyclaceae bacterium]|nr:formylglycine-generating enzyme family protein [Rhodocyclaceae bacterium]